MTAEYEKAPKTLRQPYVLTQYLRNPDFNRELYYRQMLEIEVSEQYSASAMIYGKDQVKDHSDLYLSRKHS